MICARYVVLCVALAGLSLAACTSLAERAHNECVDTGYVKGTVEYADCRKEFQQNAENRSAAIAQMRRLQSPTYLPMGIRYHTRR